MTDDAKSIDDQITISPFCPKFQHTVELVGRRWTGAVMRALMSGCTRFTELTDAIPGLSDRLLSERLKELEREGLVERVVEPTTPVKVVYTLTDKGRSLADVVSALADWADEWVDGSGPACRVSDA